MNNSTNSTLTEIEQTNPIVIKTDDSVWKYAFIVSFICNLFIVLAICWFLWRMYGVGHSRKHSSISNSKIYSRPTEKSRINNASSRIINKFSKSIPTVIQPRSNLNHQYISSTYDLKHSDGY